MILTSQKCVFDKKGLGYKSSNNEKYFKNYLSRSPQVNAPQPFATFLVEDDTLVVLVLLGIDLKRSKPLSQRRLGLKNQRSLTTKDLKRFGYLKFLDFLL